MALPLARVLPAARGLAVGAEDRAMIFTDYSRFFFTVIFLINTLLRSADFSSAQSNFRLAAREPAGPVNPLSD